MYSPYPNTLLLSTNKTYRAIISIQSKIPKFIFWIIFNIYSCPRNYLFNAVKAWKPCGCFYWKGWNFTLASYVRQKQIIRDKIKTKELTTYFCLVMFGVQIKIIFHYQLICVHFNQITEVSCILLFYSHI